MKRTYFYNKTYTPALLMRVFLAKYVYLKVPKVCPRAVDIVSGLSCARFTAVFIVYENRRVCFTRRFATNCIYNQQNKECL